MRSNRHTRENGKRSNRSETKTERGSWRAPVPVAAGALVAGAGLWFALEGSLSYLVPSDELGGVVAGFGIWAPLVFLAVQVAQVILAPIPGTATVAVGAALFGPWEGFTLGLSGAVIGSVVVFVLARRWGPALVAKLVGDEAVERYAGAFGAGGWWFFATLTVPFFPDDVLCALAGLSALSFRRFLVFVVVGRLPHTALTSFIAADLLDRPTGPWVAIGLLVLVGLALLVKERSRLEAWFLRRASAGR